MCVAPVVLLTGVANECTTATTGPVPPGGGAGGFEETAYGPPWGGIQGEGVTAYGIDLQAGQPMLEIAIDPTVLTPRGYYHVWPNPFNTHGAFIAGDTGGAIKGRHIDTYDWQGRASQDAWGVHYGVSVTPAADPGAANSTDEIQAPASTPTTLQSQCAPAAGPVAPGVYVNPFRASTSITPARIDMGVDYAGTGTIQALGDATVTYAQQGGTGWGPFSCTGGYAGAIVYRLTDGPDQGRYIYLTEGIIPTVHTGQQLTAGQPIATFTGCIEIG